jgi:hypothetical protein
MTKTFCQGNIVEIREGYLRCSCGAEFHFLENVKRHYGYFSPRQRTYNNTEEKKLNYV